MNQLRVLLVEDHAEFRSVLRKLLEPEFAVVAELIDGQNVLAAVKEFRPDIVLLDITLPGKNGFEVLDELRIAFPYLRVVFLTTYRDPLYVQEAFRRGATSFVWKGSAASELIPILRQSPTS